MADKKLQIIIEAVDKASKVIGEIAGSADKLTRNLSDLSKDVKQVGKNLTLGLTVPLIGAGLAIAGLTERAGKVESVTDAFQSMVKDFGIGGEALIESVKKATSGTVSSYDVMTNFLKAKTLIGSEALGEGGENFERFAVIAKKAARATGADVNFLFESIVTGIGRTSTKWLDNTGVVIDATNAYALYAKEVGKSIKALTEEEKKIAMTNAFLEKAERLYKDVAVSAGGYSSELARMKVTTEEARDAIGEALIPAMQSLLETITPMIRDFVPALTGLITGLTSAFDELSPTTQGLFLAFLGLAVVIGPLIAVLGFLISPISLVMGAIALFILQLDALSEAITKGTEYWKTEFSESLEFIKKAFEGQWEKIVKVNEAFFSTLGNLFFDNFAMLMAITDVLTGGMVTKFMERLPIITLNFNTMVENLRVANQKMKDNVLKTLDEILAKYIVTSLDTKRTIQQMADDAIFTIKTMRDNVVKAITDLADKVKNIIGGLQDWVADHWPTWGIHIQLPDFSGIRRKFEEFRGSLPSFQHGGTIPGAFNQPVPAILHGGERVIPKTGVNVNTGGGSGTTINLTIEGDVSSMEMLEKIGETIKNSINRENELARLGLGV